VVAKVALVILLMQVELVVLVEVVLVNADLLLLQVQLVVEQAEQEIHLL
tara:strand:- start:428 stop:574 length:147 start_codon:yes stop_codon:yes gene_type:complete